MQVVSRFVSVRLLRKRARGEVSGVKERWVGRVPRVHCGQVCGVGGLYRFGNLCVGKWDVLWPHKGEDSEVRESV